VAILFGLPLPFTWLERKIAGHIQVRPGPMRVGFHGILQPVADGIKLFLKEDIIPDGADKVLFKVAPFVALVPYVAIFVAIPMSDRAYISNMDIGVLYILGIGGLSIYGFILAGWASNSKYALLGGMRATAQMISYEVAMGFAVIGVVMMGQSLNLQEIVRAQEGGFWNWNFIPQIVAFFIFMVAGFAEANRIPFDIPEGEGELGAGYHTEYSGMRFALFALAEYVAMFSVSALAVLLFMGGWNAPVAALEVIPGVIWFILKVFAMVYFFMWTRFTWPRYRYDQLMSLGWKFLIPLGVANVLITGLFVIDF
jgi:NADH-quinone oxidoreductase subunit H